MNGQTSSGVTRRHAREEPHTIAHAVRRIGAGVGAGDTRRLRTGRWRDGGSPAASGPTVRAVGPEAQPPYWEPGPPSSQIPSLVQDEVHVSRQVQLAGGGGEGEGGPFHGAGGGGAPTSKLLVTVHG